MWVWNFGKWSSCKVGNLSPVEVSSRLSVQFSQPFWGPISAPWHCSSTQGDLSRAKASWLSPSLQIGNCVPEKPGQWPEALQSAHSKAITGLPPFLHLLLQDSALPFSPRTCLQSPRHTWAQAPCEVPSWQVLHCSAAKRGNGSLEGYSKSPAVRHGRFSKMSNFSPSSG